MILAINTKHVIEFHIEYRKVQNFLEAKQEAIRKLIEVLEITRCEQANKK